MRRTLAALALMCSAFSVRAKGQVSGSVRDAATSEPVRGAAVVVLGAKRELLGRTITSSSGTFRIVHDSAAIIRVMRIGYAPLERRLEGAGSSLVIELTPLGRRLRAVTVTSSPLCRPRADQQEALALWSSATDAFSSMIVASTESTHTGEVEQLLYDRVVAAGGTRILRQSTQRVTTTNVSPIRAARPTSELVQHGYVIHRSEASTYYAPDPMVLLDSSFAATHCLSLRRDEKSHAGEIGVAFTPTSDRDSLADIAGVLWMKRSPMALTSLDFEYRGVDQILLQMDAGGRLSFETLSNGMPIIREWLVRSPALHYFTSGPPRGPLSGWVGGRAALRGEIHEGGGFITDGELEGGTRITAPLATLGGRLQIRPTREPVAGTTVALDSTDDATVTDVEGRFSLTRLLPGPYTLRATDSVVIDSVRVDSAGRSSSYSGRQQIVRRIATMQVQANLEHVNSFTLNFPSPAPSPTCRFEGTSGRLHTVVGLVANSARQPVPHTRLELTWADTTKQWKLDGLLSLPNHTSTGTSMEVVTDSKGEFVACGIPHSRLIVARLVTLDGEVTGTARVSARPDDVSRRLRNNELREMRLIVQRPD